MDKNQKEMSPEDKEALKKILKLDREEERVVVSIIKNKGTYVQYKITIPKKFAKAIELNEKKHKAIFILTKEVKESEKISKLTMELIDKNGT